MTREEFIKALKDNGYFYEIEGDKLVVTHSGTVGLRSLNSLPSDMKFNNEGDVNLPSLRTIPSGVEFNNEGGVNLSSLETIPSGMEFNNGGYVDLRSLVTLPSGVEFNNGGDVWLSLIIGGRFSGWEGNIEGIGNKTLLNMMIKREIFSR